MALPIYPDWPPPDSTTPGRGDSGRDPTQRPTAMAGIGSRLPLIYGRAQVAGRIALAVVFDSALYLLAVWGAGRCESIVGVIGNGEPFTADRTDYLGTTDQDADPWLVAAIDGYADALPGICYSVIRITDTELFPSQLTAEVEGLHVYDPRTGSTAYSSNPALAIMDLASRAGETIDWAGSLAAINYCDEDIEGYRRWTIGIEISEPRQIAEHIEELRAYAHCLRDYGPDGLILVPDAARAVDATITAADIVRESMRLARRPTNDTPTAVRLTYTDVSPPGSGAGDPWGTATVLVTHPGISTGTPYIESALTMPGIHSHQEAMRSATERLNAYTLRNLTADLVIRDEGLSIQTGDVVSVTDPIGLAAKPMRVLSASLAEPGRWALSLEEYDPATYSDVIEEAPTYPDTGLPSPFDIPAPSGLAADEEVYQGQDGVYRSRLRLTWSADDYPYSHDYRVTVHDGAMLVWSGTTESAEYATGAVLEGRTYTAAVAILARIGLTGPSASVDVAAQGKGLIPGDVPRLDGFEVGGEVRLSWLPAIDIDIWRYELRYGPTDGDWASATLIDRTDSLRLVTRDVPPGEWRFYCRAIDSIGQYSAGDAVRDITVTLDTQAFFVGSHAFSYASGSNLYLYEDRYGTEQQWTELGTGADVLWPGPANDYADPWVGYDHAGASEWVSDTWDLGLIGDADEYAGTFQADWTPVLALGSSTITQQIELSTDGATWTPHTATSIRDTASLVRLRVSAESGNAFMVRGAPSVRLDVVARESSGIATTLASGGKTVAVDGQYAFAKSIVLTPSGTAPRTAVYDNVQMGATAASFDIYLFDSAGAQVAGDVSWRFQGV